MRLNETPRPVPQNVALDANSGAGRVNSAIPKTGNAFIDRVSDDAIRSQRATGVPASVTLAQAILESGWGKSGLSTKANNYFGIKGEGPAGHVTMRTREVFNGKEVFVNAKFRKYNSPAESFTDHGKFLRENSRYRNAFKHTDNPQRFAQELQKAGYATDPKYASLLNSIIQQHGLERFDKIARDGGSLPPPPPSTGGNQGSDGVDRPSSGGATQTLKEGSRGSAVKGLQKQLKAAGFDPGTPDGVFGPKTEAAVKSFQRAHKLEADGIVGPKTRQALREATTPRAPSGPSGAGSLKEGSKGERVKDLQSALNKLGYGAGKADGEFGPQTRSAVEHFQSVNKLTVDGIAGPKTMAMLESGKARKAPAPDVGGGGNVGEIGPRARKEMNALVDIARRNTPGTVGLCYGAVSKYLDIARANGNGYGKTNFNFRAGPGQEVAAQFGEWLNKPGNAEKAGLRRLSITNPYDAPKGAIVVVGAGSPGTSRHEWWVNGTNGKRPHPSWAGHKNWPGDISVATGNGGFINDHSTQQYGGNREAWERAVRAGTAKMIGIYVPAN